MKKVLRFIVIVFLALYFNGASIVSATTPDPTAYWQTLIFGPDQIKPGDTDASLLLLNFFGQHAGWGSKKNAITNSYEIEFFAAMVMPKLVLSEEEYTLFRDIHILSKGGVHNYLFTPFGAQNPTEYYEVVVSIDVFCNIQITPMDTPEGDLYAIRIEQNDILLPVVYLTQSQYDTFLVHFNRYGPGTLRFDEIEWGDSQ